MLKLYRIPPYIAGAILFTVNIFTQKMAAAMIIPLKTEVVH
jgi:hypothetical protein